MIFQQQQHNQNESVWFCVCTHTHRHTRWKIHRCRFQIRLHFHFAPIWAGVFLIDSNHIGLSICEHHLENVKIIHVSKQQSAVIEWIEWHNENGFTSCAFYYRTIRIEVCRISIDLRLRHTTNGIKKDEASSNDEDDDGNNSILAPLTSSLSPCIYRHVFSIKAAPLLAFDVRLIVSQLMCIRTFLSFHHFVAVWHSERDGIREIHTSCSRKIPPFSV